MKAIPLFFAAIFGLNQIAFPQKLPLNKKVKKGQAKPKEIPRLPENEHKIQRAELPLFVEKHVYNLKQLLNYDEFDIRFHCKRNAKSVYSCFPTFFHERLHYFNDSINILLKANQKRYFFLDGKIEETDRIAVFNSIQMDPIIPEKIRDSIERYNLYIRGKTESLQINKPETMINGIYGLIEELIAYYTSARVYDKLTDYIRETHREKSSEFWFDFLGEMGSTATACLEFKVFIGYYLLYAKKNQPAIYSAIISNNGLTSLLKLVLENSKNIYKRYLEIRDQLTVDSKGNIFVMNGFLVSTFTDNRYFLPDGGAAILNEAITPELTQLLAGL